MFLDIASEAAADGKNLPSGSELERGRHYRPHFVEHAIPGVFPAAVFVATPFNCNFVINELAHY
jgi:hypothetical protein